MIILDTNIFPDLISEYNSNNLLRVLQDWLTHVVQNIDCNPKGDSITLATTTQILNDYQTGLSKAGYGGAGKAFSSFFKNATSFRYKLDEGKNIYLSIKKINASRQWSRAVQDKYDVKFLNLINEILYLNKFNDRFIIFATNDSTAGPDIEKALVGKAQVCVEIGIPNLEEAIKC